MRDEEALIGGEEREAAAGPAAEEGAAAPGCSWACVRAEVA